MRRVKAVSEKEPYVVEISTEKHHWNADEPPDLGGRDAGPSPYELLLGSVGACMMITARMYAARKGWPIQSMSVELDFSRVRAEECEDCESEKGLISQIGIQMSLEGDLDRAQRQRVFEIAGKCPVKRTLEGEVKIRSELLEGH
jgi:putative redox protein